MALQNHLRSINSSPKPGIWKLNDTAAMLNKQNSPTSEKNIK